MLNTLFVATHHRAECWSVPALTSCKICGLQKHFLFGRLEQSGLRWLPVAMSLIRLVVTILLIATFVVAQVRISKAVSNFLFDTLRNICVTDCDRRLMDLKLA
jgi:hypothetical protein